METHRILNTEYLSKAGDRKAVLNALKTDLYNEQKDRPD